MLLKGGTPLFLGLEVHVEFDIEEPRRVDAVIGTPYLTGTFGGLGKRAKDQTRLIGDPDSLAWTGAGSKRPAHPQRALIQVRKEFRSNQSADRQIDRARQTQ